MNVIPFDRRAIHRIVSDPSVLDIANDIDADAQEVVTLVQNAHFMALGTGNEQLVRCLTRIGSKVVHVRKLVHQGLDLYAESIAVDPYKVIDIKTAPKDAA